jgi:ZIP family zinc transporter
VIEAGLWGFIAAAFLIVGAILAFVTDIPTRVRGVILAFGAGTLFGAVAYELFEEAVRTAMSGLSVLVGFGLGAVVFYLGSVLIDRMSGAAPAEAGAARHDAPPRSPSRRDPRTDGLAIVLGAILDGIPESIVLGASLIAGTGVGIPVLVAIAVSNVPEALSASKDLANAGIARSRILGLWFGVAVVSALAAGIGFGVLSGAPQGAVAFIQAFAAGAILAMLSESMIPEAQEIGGRAVGLATSFGFAVAASLSFVA